MKISLSVEGWDRLWRGIARLGGMNRERQAQSELGHSVEEGGMIGVLTCGGRNRAGGRNKKILNTRWRIRAESGAGG